MQREGEGEGEGYGGGEVRVRWGGRGRGRVRARGGGAGVCVFLLCCGVALARFPCGRRVLCLWLVSVWELVRARRSHANQVGVCE